MPGNLRKTQDAQRLGQSKTNAFFIGVAFAMITCSTKKGVAADRSNALIEASKVC